MGIAIRTYSKTELSDLYNIDVRTLVNWIKRNTSLFNELSETGYKPKQRNFTPKQVEMIFKELGEPHTKKDIR